MKTKSFILLTSLICAIAFVKSNYNVLEIEQAGAIAICYGNDTVQYGGGIACSTGGGCLVKAASIAIAGTGGTPLGWGIAGVCLIA